MPDWLKIAAQVNPLSYMVDALQASLVTSDFNRLPTDLGVVVLSVVMLTGLATLASRRILD